MTGVPELSKNPLPVLDRPDWATPLSIGGVELESRFTLAPLAGYTNLPFRLTVREIGGVGLCTTDLVNARAILQGSPKTLELLATTPEDRPLSVQLYGNEAEYLVPAAQYVESLGVNLIDINMGCPVRKVVKTGGGSAMMCDTTGTTVELIQKVVECVKLPVTVKMRLGWDEHNLTAPYFAREFEQIGVKAITIHGRTREQGFSGVVDLDGIRQVVEAVENIPVIGNGDVRTIRDAHRMITQTGCDAVAIGRGALSNPWFFRQLSRWAQNGDPGPRGTYEERLHLMKRHFERVTEWRGERAACLQFRKMAAWYCKALKTGKQIQHQLVMIDTPKLLDDIIAQLFEKGPPPGWNEADAMDANIHVPSGPIAHW